MSRQTCLAVAEVKEKAFALRQQRGEVALAFGAEHPARCYYDLDAVAILVTGELARQFRLKDAAGIVRSFGDLWLDAVGRSDFDPQTMYFGVGELETNEGNAFVVTGGTLAEVEEDFDKTNPSRMMIVNVRHLLIRLRANAKAIGIDLSDPLLPPPDHPEYRKLIEEVREVRDGALARLRAKRAEAEARR